MNSAVDRTVGTFPKGSWPKRLDLPQTVRKGEEEGGCGVVGFCCTEPVPGRHIYEPSKQMHNRGNGKGGGIAAVGLRARSSWASAGRCSTSTTCCTSPSWTRTSGPRSRRSSSRRISMWPPPPRWTRWTTGRRCGGLEVKPPDVWRYFVRVKPKVLDDFIQENGLQELDRREAEDEFVSQNSFKLNQKFYASLGEQAGLRPVPRPEHHDPQGRRLRRGHRQILQDRGPLRPCLDRPPALPDQGPRLASRRGASVCGA